MQDREVAKGEGRAGTPVHASTDATSERVRVRVASD